jgi:hypothetical protein
MPHPEERPLGRVSKDAEERTALLSSFETPLRGSSERVNVLVLSVCNGWGGVIPSMW